MAIIMLARATARLHLIWGIFCITVMLWGLGAYQIGISKDPARALFWWKFAYIGVIFIPIMFTHFVYIFLQKENKFFILFFYVLGGVYLIANLFTDSFINATHLMFNQIYFLTPTPLYNSYFALFIILVIYSHTLLFKEYKRAVGLRKQQIQYFFIGSFLGFFGGSFSFLPEYHINIYPFMNLTVSFYPIIMGFAILRYRLMNINVIMAQLLVASLWVFISVRTLISEFGSHEQLLNIALLLITIIVGILLNNSVIKEIKSREEIEKLAKDLEAANEKLRKFDEAKSEFISLAGHQLRTPLTVIKGYTSMLMEGTFGEIDKKALAPMEKVFAAANNLTKLVSELLDLSRIESGRLKYEFKMIYFDNIVEEVVKEFKQVSEEKRIAVEFVNKNNRTFKIYGDADKLREVVMNLLDNAFKYSEIGPIVVTLTPKAKSMLLSVADRGFGMPRDEMPRLFQKFGRTEIAKKERPEGMGIGLYFVKKIIDDHKGRIWAESQGLGKGSIFFVELPVKYDFQEENERFLSAL
ncbi:MAG: hypothetical protein HYW15_02265 [Candidatus Giovannonibacteria bacterium]|nr:MAG: hypothetical protein HYW15_02265 [Candidatus Giovannonibacteria bacterium]